MPVVAEVKTNPNVINLKSKGEQIKCTINLSDGLKEKDIESDPLQLSNPSCMDCQPIKALGGYAAKRKYSSFFAREDLVNLIKAHQEDHRHFLVRVSGHMKLGNLFEGDLAIEVRSNSK